MAGVVAAGEPESARIHEFIAFVLAVTSAHETAPRVFLVGSDGKKLSF